MSRDLRLRSGCTKTWRYRSHVANAIRWVGVRAGAFALFDVGEVSEKFSLGEVKGVLWCRLCVCLCCGWGCPPCAHASVRRRGGEEGLHDVEVFGGE
eukprot:scaffold13102_cov39-Attheya_sp.AAC.1